MNYWGAQVANLPELTENIFRLLEDVAITGARTAVEMYGTTSTATGTGGGPGKGAPWVLHHNTDQWRATAPIDGAYYGFWPTGGAWLLQTLWEHYSYAPSNMTFVQRAYPLWRGASQFFLETLQQHPTNSGWLVTNPSMSPEHPTPSGASTTIGPHIDNAILRDLFDQTVQFATILNTDASFVSSVKAARAKLPPFQVGSAGQLQEWLWDWDNQATKIFSHISHLYGLFPSAQIDPRLTSSLANAAKISLQIRGNGSEGWPIAWRIGCWARLLDKGMAQTETNLLLSSNGVYPNLMGKNSIFQIDSNLGGMATILEMYLQSHNGQIFLLPAVASSTPSGTITGIRARGGFTVSLSWSNSALVSATITSTGGTNPTVRYGSSTKTFTLGSGSAITLTPSSFN
jgi:alpha-L-fucosidase 2